MIRRILDDSMYSTRAYLSFYTHGTLSRHRAFDFICVFYIYIFYYSICGRSSAFITYFSTNTRSTHASPLIFVSTTLTQSSFWLIHNIHIHIFYCIYIYLWHVYGRCMNDGTHMCPDSRPRAIKSRVIQRLMVIKIAASSYQGYVRLVLVVLSFIHFDFVKTTWDNEWWWCHFLFVCWWMSEWVSDHFDPFLEFMSNIYDLTVRGYLKISHAISATVSTHTLVSSKPPQFICRIISIMFRFICSFFM